MNISLKSPSLTLLTLSALIGLPACAGGMDDMGDPAMMGESGDDTDDTEAAATTDTATTGVNPSTTAAPDTEGEDPEDTEGEDTDGGETEGEDPEDTDGGDTDGTTGDTEGEETGETGDTEGEETGSTGEAPPEAPDDGDNPSAPAVSVQFRATSPGPISVDEALFNEDPIDTRGLQYLEQLSVPGDDLDVVDFRIVPGQVDPVIRIELECDNGDATRVRAEVFDDAGDMVDSVGCGEGEASVLLDNASSMDVYQVQVLVREGEPLLTNYTLSINGYCFQQCNYAPYAG